MQLSFDSCGGFVRKRLAGAFGARDGNVRSLHPPPFRFGERHRIDYLAGDEVNRRRVALACHVAARRHGPELSGCSKEILALVSPAMRLAVMRTRPPPVPPIRNHRRAARVKLKSLSRQFNEVVVLVPGLTVNWHGRFFFNFDKQAIV